MGEFKRFLDVLPEGTKRWFEYHCDESPQSADRHLFLRSHQIVTVGKCVNLEDYGQYPRRQRSEGGHPLVYKIKFDDGFVGDAFEDELLYRKSQFYRPDPPKVK